jgi:hypothetical protein
MGPDVEQMNFEKPAVANLSGGLGARECNGGGGLGITDLGASGGGGGVLKKSVLDRELENARIEWGRA